MIWRVLNLLFGWDYIVWMNSCDQGVARVHKDGAGIAWYWRYRITSLPARITRADQVLWLTCAPTKYLADREPQGGNG